MYYIALFNVLIRTNHYFCVQKSNIMHLIDLIKTIKERRETLKLSQESLAEIARVSLRTLKLLESGKGNPTINTLEKLADVLGMQLKLEVKQNVIIK